MTQQTRSGPAWVSTFLDTLARTGKVGHAVDAAGITPGSAYFRRRRNRAFADAWEAALAPKGAGTPATGSERASLPASNAGWRKGFFETLAETSNVSAAALRANVPLKTVYKARRSDPAFATKWREALFEGYDTLEMELLGHLRDPHPTRKMDVAAAIRLLAAHRATAERERALREEEDEETVRASIDAFLEGMRQRRIANEALLAEEEEAADVAE
jgi:hypothetical protein